MTDTLKPAELDLEALKKVALAVTPGDIDSAPEKGEYGHKERDKWYACPTCDGQGEVFGATYCNFDDKPLGVQFFGIGAEFGRWEDYFRAFRPSAVLSLLTRIEALEAERDEARARLRNVPGLTPFNDAEDAAWPLAMARLQNTEPGPDQGIAMVGTGDLELALRRLSQFADVALRNAAVIGGLEARALSAEAQRDRMREALELARGRITMLMPADLPGSDHPGATQYVLSKVEAALSQRSGEEG